MESQVGGGVQSRVKDISRAVKRSHESELEMRNP